MFLFHCASFVVLALVFLPELYSAAYRTPFHSWPVDEDVFFSLRVLGGYLLVVSLVFDFVCVLVSCVFIFIILCVFCVPSWRQYPLLVTFLCVSFCLLSLHFFSNPTVFWLDEKIIVFFRARPEILLSEPPRRFGSATSQTKALLQTMT